MTTLYLPSDPALLATKAECDNCGTIRPVRDLENAPNIGLRQDASGPEAIGQCPDCGALAYLIKTDGEKS